MPLVVTSKCLMNNTPIRRSILC